MHEAVIVEGVRTPMGKRNGKLREHHPVVLGSLVLKELMARSGVDPAEVEDVVFGCVMQTGEQGLNIGRNAWLAAGFPVETAATTVDRQCGSSQQAIHFAANLIQSGVADVTVAGGVEAVRNKLFPAADTPVGNVDGAFIDARISAARPPHPVRTPEAEGAVCHCCC